MLTEKCCKVLIVDDEHLIRQGVKHSINWEQEGFKLIGEATNGKEAMDLIEILHPHIVVTDIVMPIMDGKALTRAIKEKYPAIEVIILSSFADFDYVRSTFQLGISDYILKPQLEGPELLKKLKEAAEKIPNIIFVNESDKNRGSSIEYVVERMMAGYEIEEDTMLIRQASFPHEYFCLVGIKLKELSIIEQLSMELEKEFHDYFSMVKMIRLPNYENIISFLFNYERNQLQTVKEFVKTMAVKKRELELDWILAEPFDELTELKEVFEGSLLPLFHYHFYLPDATVILFDDIPSKEKMKHSFQLTKFTAFFQRHQFQEAFSYLDLYITNLSNQYTTDEYEFKSLLGNIIFNITILLANMEFESEEMAQEKYLHISLIEEAKDVREVLELFELFLNQANLIIAEGMKKSQKPNMQRILDYVHEHFAEPLNLTDMGKKFHYNPSYLSNYFSDHNHQSFSEYLKQVRIQKSIELLQEEIPISKISASVGYSDHSYFCRVFKNTTGLSPSSYRRKYFNERKRMQ